MKQYLILLKSSDFIKNNNIWTSNSINLYSNNQYKNYSYTRSNSGLNLIGDRTFVGTEVTSPSYQNETIPVSENVIYKTDYGEIVYESATPSLLRFIDTTSRVDVLSYRHLFVNIPGSAYPAFNLQIYESDSENGPWLRSVFSSDSNTIFLRNCKPYIKIELDLFADGIDLDTLGLLFYLEIGIHDPIPNTISNTTKNILKRFPSWTKLFEDSQEDATPELATPGTVGGRFVNALVQEGLDAFRAKVDYQLINSFIGTANIDQLAWCYMANNISSNINTIIGDGIQLARASNLSSFFSSRENDYIFYYNPIDRQILTVRNFNQLQINGITIELEPINIFNDFDEFGARLGLPRLYLESNDNYRKRILDVSINRSSSSLEGFKRVVRRELDLWRAYGSTPDSDYLGATPIIFEISDIENSTPYIDLYGNPTKSFRSFVDNINEKYPSNLGYVNWNETVYDAGGIEGDGLGRLSSRYDYSATPSFDDYQNGVGDLGDLRFEILPSNSATINFSGMAHISGTKRVGFTDYYSPIVVDYESYSTYMMQVSDYKATKSNIGVVYEVDLPPHNNYATPSTFYANVNYENYDELIVGNRYLDTHQASPEFVLFKVFDQEGFSVIQFKDKEFDSLYLNTDSTPMSSKVSVYDAEEIRVVFSKTWNPESQEYESLTVDNYRFSFNTSTPDWVSDPLEGSTISMATPIMDWSNSSIKIGSNIYQSKQETFNTKISYNNTQNPQSGRVILNDLNDPTILSGATINTFDLVNQSLIPSQATPLHLYIDVKAPGLYPLYNGIENATPPGGVAYDADSDQLWLVASSPNILWQSYDNSNTAIGSEDYFDHATISYSATPAYIRIESDDKPGYPFQKSVYEKFISSTTPDFFSGYIDQNNNTYRLDENLQNAFFNQDQLLGNFELDKSSFGLDSSDHIVNTVFFSATPNSIIINSNLSSVGLAQELTNNFILNEKSVVNIFAKKEDFSDGLYDVGVGPGWIYLNDQEYYNFVDPFTDSATGQYFELELTDTPRAGAPIIVEVDGSELRNVVFEDSATPGKTSFYNKEIVKANYDGSLPLAYENISDITVVDTYTGQTIVSGKSSDSSLVYPFLNNYFTSVNGGSFAVAHNQALNLSSGLDYDIIFKMQLSEEMLDIAETYYLLFFTGLYTSSGYRVYLVRNGSDFKFLLLTHNSVPVGESGGTGSNITSNYFPNTFNSARWFRISRSSSSSDFNEYSGNSLKFYYAEDSEDIPSSWVDLGYDAYYSADYSSYSATPDVVNDKAYWLWDTPNVASNSDLDFFQLDDEPYTAEGIPTADMYVFKIWNGDYQSGEPILDIDFTKQPNNTLSFNEDSNNNALVTISGDDEALSNNLSDYVVGRTYEVQYHVDDAYFVDKDIYNNDTGTYSSKLYFSSTPNTSATPDYIYNITYELSDLNKSNPINLDINQISNPLDEGFVYLSKEEYDFSNIKTHLSPGYISDDQKDFMALTIISYDINGNLKPNQTFEISGVDIAATPEYVTTNRNGLATSIIRYAGPIPSILEDSNINIVGIASSTPNGNPNSSNAGFSKIVSFNILNRFKNRLELKAVPVRYNIDADQLTNNTIVGKLYWEGKPLEASVNINWSKARTLYDLFNETNSYQVGASLQSNSFGEFEIVNEIVSESQIQPGYWFAKVEIADSEQIENLLSNLDQVIDINEITISGDVIYWYEEFDNVHFTNEYTPLPNSFIFEKQMNSDLIDIPNFVYRHNDQLTVMHTDSTPNWIPPRWVPLRRFDQYQMGLLGATPYYVSGNSLMHPDTKED